MKYLYKYDTRIERLQELLELNSLSFTSPKTFNDPFDCKINYSFNRTNLLDHTYRSSIVDCLQKDLKIIHDEGRLLEVSDPLELLDPETLEGVRQDTENNMRAEKNVHGVYCLTESSTNILMWSHYACKHTGFCIEYDVEVLKENNLELFKVAYSTRTPESDLFIHHPQDIIKIFSTKSTDWMYEQEWRILLCEFMGDEEYKLYQLSNCCVTKVILGSRCVNEEEIHSICSAHSVEVTRMQEVENDFSLEEII